MNVLSMDPNLYEVGEPEVLRTVMVNSPVLGEWEGKAPAVQSPPGGFEIFSLFVDGSGGTTWLALLSSASRSRRR